MTGQIGVDAKLIVDKTQEKAQAEHMNLLAHFDEQKRKRELALPTTDKGVKQKLRSMGQPICMFGEEARDRRERLRDLMVQMEQGGVEMPDAGEEDAMDEATETQVEDDEKNQLFYTEGSEELKAPRDVAAHADAAEAALARPAEESAELISTAWEFARELAAEQVWETATKREGNG